MAATLYVIPGSNPSMAAWLRVVPEFPGRVAPVFPAPWLEPLREAAATAG